MKSALLRGGSAMAMVALLGAGVLAASSAAAQQAAPTAAPNIQAQPGTTQTPGDVEVQQQRQDATTPDAQTQDANTPQDVVVTGSLLRTTTETASPVTTLTSDTLAKAGITNINDAIRSVSADGAGSISTGFQGGFSAGGASVSLRGLGVSSTLVLVDGLRSTNFPLNDDGHNAYVDLNSIPFSIVERVDVLKDGASSTYGADAIGGVVNLIFKKQFNGLTGTVEGGVGEHGYASRYRANLTGGIGDYDKDGWNAYLNAEYQYDGPVSGRDVGYPFNTTDLSRSGLSDLNTADSSLTTATINGQVARTTQSNLNDPFTGGVALTPSGFNADGSPFYNFTSLTPLANCPRGTFTSTSTTNRGSGCRHDTTLEYSQIQPKQERYSFTGRASFRLTDDIEAYILASYAHNKVDILFPTSAPPAIRNRQPYGAAANQASNNPGIVLPYFVCSAGVNCATAADRRLNPNNPYATNSAATSAIAAANAARIYYLFGDIENSSTRKNEVFRAAAGLNGHFGDNWNWKIDGVYARDNLDYISRGVVNIAGLRQVVNTGAYNFINPSLNTDAVRNIVAPTLDVPSHTELYSVDASISKALFALPGGDFQVAVGGQVRREIEENNSLNPVLANYANTAQAFGKHTVTAGYFEIDAPIINPLDINVSGRYDHYSEGFSHFSPKVGATFTPVRQLKLRGTYSQGFRAPTFAESNPRSAFPGFVTYTLPANFVAAHGGSSNPYSQPYSAGGGFSGNPDLKPEKSRSFTAGAVFQPVRWLSFTVDYYNIKKDDVIVAGPSLGAARDAYYSQSNVAAAVAAVSAIPGYSVAALDAPDPLFPNALPRVLLINGPYANAGYFKTQGLDFGANAAIPITDDIKFTSRLDLTDVLKFDVDFGDGVKRKYVGTVGPFELSSGAGTPKWRGNWQNTLEFGPLSLSATVYYVSSIKQVAADEYGPGADGRIDLSCSNPDNDLYQYPNDAARDRYCKIKRFVYGDLNIAYRVNDQFTFTFNVGNVTNERAPIAPASYSGVNYLPTWHYAGVIGRTLRAGASFKF